MVPSERLMHKLRGQTVLVIEDVSVRRPANERKQQDADNTRHFLLLLSNHYDV